MHLRASVGNEVLEQVVGVVVSSVLLNVHLDDAFEIAAPANHSQVKKGDAEMGCLVACCIAIRDINATNHRTSKLSGGDGVDVLAIHGTVLRQVTIVDTVDLSQQDLLNVRVCLDKVFDSHSEAEPEEVALQLMWLHVCLGCECG